MTLKGYTNIPDWMLTLDLDVYETIILAVIYGFSQDGDSTFKGSQKYLSEKAKCSKRKVATALVSLVEKRLVEKIDINVRGIHLCEYKTTDYCTMCMGIAQDAIGDAQNAGEGIAQGATNNIDNIHIIEEKKDSLSFPYSSDNFKSLWAVLIQQPKWKKKSQSALQMSLNKLGRESEPVAIQMMEDAIANGWQGLFPPKTSGSSNQRESVYSHNMRTMSNLLGK